MKKLLNIALVLVFSMALLTGCGETENKPTPTPTPAPTPTPVVQRPETDEIDPMVYESVVNLWKGVGGYWAKADGSYIQLGIDVNGKAYAHAYDKDNKLTAVIMPTSIMASNKLTYVVETTYPAISGDNNYPDFTQEAKEKDFVVDINGIDDGFFLLTAGEGVDVHYVLAGKTTDNLAKAVKTADGLDNPKE